MSGAIAGTPAADREWHWSTVILYVVLAPGLVMLVDYVFVIAGQTGGFSLARYVDWIFGDRFEGPRYAYLIGFLPALIGGLTIAARERGKRTAPFFALFVTAIFGVIYGVLIAENLFIFDPPPLPVQLWEGGRGFLAVMIGGMVCYGIIRLIRKSGEGGTAQ